MSVKVKAGDKVQYKVGKGYGKGTVIFVSDGQVLIQTAKGKQITREEENVKPDND